MINSVTVARYIKKFARVSQSLGPSEERGFALWVGYDIEGATEDLSHLGLIAADVMSEEELRTRGVTSFLPVSADDDALRRKLGLETK